MGKNKVAEGGGVKCGGESQRLSPPPNYLDVRFYVHLKAMGSFGAEAPHDDAGKIVILNEVPPVRRAGVFGMTGGGAFFSVVILNEVKNLIHSSDSCLLVGMGSFELKLSG